MAELKRYGWFEYSDDPFVMRNYKSDQELILEEEKVEEPNKSLGKLISLEVKKLFKKVKAEEYEKAIQKSFLYKDEEIQQSIIVDFVYHTDKFQRLEIIVDYNLSFPSPPSYGLWRRIDAFVTDALLCWPERIFKKDFYSGLKTIGGWYQGKWSRDFTRDFSGRKSYTVEQLEKQPQPIVDPYIVPLDLPVPKQWSYVDHKNPATEASLEFSTDNEYKVPFLGRGEEIKGFQDKVPYLVREDNQAYIFISKLEPSAHRGEDPEVILRYTYIDENVFFTFRSVFSYGLEIGGTGSCTNYGFRELPPKKELWATNIFGEYQDKTYGVGSYSYLSYKIWIMTLNTIIDAWPKWYKVVKDGMVRKIEVDPSVELPPQYGRRAYVGNFGHKIHGGFTAGISNTWYEVFVNRK